jgi:uncharacterized protein YfaS (alpha-2-macroglobulin family)/TolA-binding protein
MTRSRVLFSALLALSFAAPAFAGPASVEDVRQALRERSFSEANQLATQRIKLHPQELETRYLRALSFFHQKELSKARADAAFLSKNHPTTRWASKARFLEAECLSRERNFMGAVKILHVEARRLLSAERKRQVCGVILRFADALARKRDPNNPADLDGPKPDFRKAYVLYGKALELEIDEVLRESVLFKRAKAAETFSPHQAAREYQAYLQRFDPTWGDAPGRERRPTGANRWAARERLLWASLAGRQNAMAWRQAEDLLRLLASPAGKTAPAKLGATTSWLRLRAIGLPRPPRQSLPAGLRAIDEFLARYSTHPAAVAAAWWRAEAQRTSGQHEEAIGAYTAFLAGKGFTLPAGAAAKVKLEALGASPKELLLRWTREAVFKVGAIRVQQRRFPEAIKRFQEYVRRFPNGPHWSSAHASIREAEFQLCLVAVAAKQYDLARKRFDGFLGAHPLDGRAARVLFLLGQLRVAEGEALEKKKQSGVARYRQAIAAWARLVSKYPRTNESALGLYRTGLLQEERLDQLEEALKTYRRVTWGQASYKARNRIALLTRQHLKLESERVFRSNEAPEVKVETRNLETLKVRQYFLDLEGYFHKHHETGSVERLDIALIQPDATWDVKIKGYAKYSPRKQAIPVPFGRRTSGVCIVHVAGGDYEATTLVIRSDVELVVRASREELLAFAQDARLNKPAAGVKVMISDGKKMFLKGTTGKDGVVRLKHERLRSAGSLRVFAQRAGHVAASQLGLSGLQSAVKLVPRGYVYTDRPAYQPGQTVHVKGVVREVSGGSYSLPSAKSYTVSLYDSRGRVVDAETADVTRFGTFCASFALDAKVPVGSYRVDARPKTGKGPQVAGTFHVQQFELRPLELSLIAPRTVYRRGEVVELTAKARFSWGQPAADKAVVVHLPDGRRERGRTDDKGLFKLRFDTSTRTPGAPVLFRAQLPEEGIAAALTVYLPRLGFNASVRASEALVLAGEPVEVSVETKGPDGKPVGRKLTLFVQRRDTPRPDPVLAKVPWFRPPSGASAARTVQEHSLTTDPKTGLARISITLPKGGTYLLRAVGEDRFKQSVVGAGSFRVSDADDATRLRIFSKQATLRVGQKHTSRIHARLKKPGLALITWEGDAILNHKVVRLRPGFTPLELEVGHRHFPNFRLAVTTLEEQKLHTAHKNFRVERELKVTIKPSKDRYAPGEEATVELVVTDQLGRPVQAELSLALVDETLYARFPETVEAIRDAFEKGAKRRAEFRVSASNAFRYAAKTRKILQVFKNEAQRLNDLKDSVRELKELDKSMALESRAMGRGGRRRQAAKKSESFGRSKGKRPSRRPPSMAPSAAAPPSDGAPGGMAFDAEDEAGEAEEPGAPPRRDKLGAGWWKCQIVTDAKGRATLKIPLPARTTKWRLTARGVTTKTLVGQAKAQVVTAKDFFAELLAPRHLREGDKLQLLARVHGKANQDVSLELELRDGERLLAARRALTRIGPSGSAELLLPEMKIPARGNVSLVLRARTKGASDAVTKSVSVLPWGEEIVAHGGGTASGDASVVLRLPRGQARTRWLEVMVGPSLEGALAELALNSGRGWPQSLGGRLLGLASALRYARQNKIDVATRRRLERELRVAVGGVTPRQDRGGWGLKGPNIDETCRVLWGLAQAKDVTAYVPRTTVAVRYLTNAYRRERNRNVQARILHALAEAGHADFKLANSLYRARNTLDTEASAQLALVFKILDRAAIARQLVGRLKKSVGHPSTNAWQLLALARIQPGTPAATKLATSLLQGRGTHRSLVPTYSGLVVAALAEHFGKGQPATDDARITVLLGGRPLKTITRRGASGAVRFRLSDEELGAKDEIVLRFRLEGRARYAYAATLRGFRPNYGKQSTRGWRVRSRRYLHAPLRHRGKPIGASSTSPVKNAQLGQRVEVRVDVYGRARKDAGMVVVEPLPAGAALVPGSLRGGFVHHELRDGALHLYYTQSRWAGTVSYALVGRVPGTWRVPPTRMVDARDPSRIGRGSVSQLRVLGPGAASPDPYQLNDNERYALGRLHFAEGSLAKALSYLEPLFERKRRPHERDLARMLLWIHTDSKHYDARRIVQAFEILAVRYPELEVPFDKILVVGRAYRDLREHERAMLVFRATIDASFLSDSEIGAILSDQGQNLGAVDYQEALWWDYPNTAQVAASLFATSQRLYELAPMARRLAKEPRFPLPGVKAPTKKPTRISLLARTISSLRAFLAHHPQSPLADDAAFSMANAFLDLRRHEDVVKLTQLCLKVYPKSDFGGSFQYMTALGHFWKRNYDSALSNAKVVATGKTRFHRLGKYILGQIHHAQGKPGAAIKWYTTVKSHYPDAKESIDYFQRRALALKEVTVVRPGKPVKVEVKSRNLAGARLEVYKVDLMKLYLREKDLSKITKVELAGIAPQQKLEIKLGTPTDYAEKTVLAHLKQLKDEGAYLVIARGDDLFASGLVLITPLKIEVQEDGSGRVRVNLIDEVRGLRPANVHVKAVGSGDGSFKSGETDLRGVFVADGLRGKATVIARAGDAQYAFYRGQTWLGQPARTRARPRRPQPKVDYEGYLRQQNRAMQQRSRSSWERKRRNTRKGVQIQKAR